MEQYHMAEKGERILAAVSGGADSICLLLVLLALQRERKYQLCVVHVEHGIRGEDSRKDAKFVENFCKVHKIPCKVYHCKAEDYARKHKMTVEEGARTLRYEYFEEAAREFGADKIAVAHNQNDCAETMLFHLARGTGLKGLCGILPVRGKIIRPLLCVERNEIEAYLESQGQEYCTDKTNEETAYTRNRIRHQVLPVLKEINSQVVGHMNQMASVALELQELLEQMTREAWENCVRKEESHTLLLHNIQKEKGMIQKSLVHQILIEEAGSGQDISAVHVQEVLDLVEKQVGKKVSLPYELEAERSYDGIIIGKREIPEGGETEEQTARRVWEIIPDRTIQIPEYGYQVQAKILEGTIENQEIPQKIYTKWFDYDKIKGTLSVRNRLPGDYLTIAGGGRKPVNRYMIDEKIPQSLREEIPVLAEGNHVLWVVGYRISEYYKITEDTNTILQVTADGGEKHGR